MATDGAYTPAKTYLHCLGSENIFYHISHDLKSQIDAEPSIRAITEFFLSEIPDSIRPIKNFIANKVRVNTYALRLAESVAKIVFESETIQLFLGQVALKPISSVRCEEMLVRCSLCRW